MDEGKYRQRRMYVEIELVLLISHKGGSIALRSIYGWSSVRSIELSINDTAREGQVLGL